jgi:hypothetical protein
VTCSEPNPAAAYDYNAVLTAHCDFSGLAVDAYIATVTVTGGYYAGADEDIVVVYDPSLGFTTGGGWFYWPGTTERTTFGFNMKHNKKGTNLKGSLILIRHAPDGSRYRLKSNSLGALTLDEAADAGTGDTYGWAFFSGKTTYLAPGMKGAEGNFEFSIYVEDRTEPGAGMDRFWMEVLNKDDQVVMDLSMPQNAPDNTVTINGGNIVVPHVRGSGK